MARIGTEIVITVERRPCFVGDKRARFHQWVNKSEIYAPSLLKGGHNGGVVSGTLGLVEYEDGTVAEVEPTSIRFDVEREREE